MSLHLTPLPSGAAAGPTRALDLDPASGPGAHVCRDVGLPAPVRELARHGRFAAPRRPGAALAVDANDPVPGHPVAPGAAAADPCDALHETHEAPRGRREGWWSA
ncbi:hypothetical protein OV203_22500 [Nannocystis sp. ILAH1]|uniref:hypothetical protein n=1 Tax=unclassified Nannocystis TaxID=2627009 RepID=UPI002270E2E6|nr:MULTISPECIES: hypothetical protein [unclassified Nannocystis]MCY0989927.1 hypothetical protein [Nannocystis sp. ILAH1]MCY1071036.1 hypothetical protein [Nannocystis sp. RBIL2]